MMGYEGESNFLKIFIFVIILQNTFVSSSNGILIDYYYSLKHKMNTNAPEMYTYCKPCQTAPFTQSKYWVYVDQW